MVTFPNAKINLGLDILRKRPDGYHDISTVMVPIGWCDILEVVPAAGADDTLTVTGRAVDCPLQKNLVWKALMLMRSVAEFPRVDIYLHKVIPDGAGLGGGSADAAFTLKALNELWQLGFDQPRLAAMAAQLGADCPFFIYNRPMLCEGIGERLTPIELPQIGGLCVAVVKPQVLVPTKEAYAMVRPALPSRSLPELIATLDVDQWQGAIKNDFEPSVFARHQAIARVKDLLLQRGARYASMSGSGASVFGLFDADIVADDLKAEFAQCDIFVAQIGN